MITLKYLKKFVEAISKEQQVSDSTPIVFYSDYDNGDKVPVNWITALESVGTLDAKKYVDCGYSKEESFSTAKVEIMINPRLADQLLGVKIPYMMEEEEEDEDDDEDENESGQMGPKEWSRIDDYAKFHVDCNCDDDKLRDVTICDEYFGVKTLHKLTLRSHVPFWVIERGVKIGIDEHRAKMLADCVGTNREILESMKKVAGESDDAYNERIANAKKDMEIVEARVKEINESKHNK